MANLLAILLISILAKIEGYENDPSSRDQQSITDYDSETIDFTSNAECNCSHVNSQLEIIKNMLLAQTCRKVCPSGFDYLPEVDGCYKVIFQSMNWHRSGEVCRRVMPGVHLAAITSAAKQNAIENYLQKEFSKTESSACLKTLWTSGGKSVWLSGQTRDPHRCNTPFVWKTLEAVEIPFNYTNWLQGEPNCSSNNEKCAHIAGGRNYTWNDSNCDLLSCALCEY